MSMTRREFISGMFSKDKVKDIYMSWNGFNEELKKPEFLTDDKSLLKFASKIKKKNYNFGKEGKK